MFVKVNKNGEDCHINTDYIKECSVKARIHKDNIVIRSTFIDLEGNQYKTRGYLVFTEEYILYALNTNHIEIYENRKEFEIILNRYLNTFMSQLLNGYNIGEFSSNIDEDLFYHTINKLKLQRIDSMEKKYKSRIF